MISIIINYQVLKMSRQCRFPASIYIYLFSADIYMINILWRCIYRDEWSTMTNDCSPSSGELQTIVCNELVEMRWACFKIRELVQLRLNFTGNRRGWQKTEVRGLLNADSLKFAATNRKFRLPCRVLIRCSFRILISLVVKIQLGW